MHILRDEINKKKAILLFDNWNPKNEGRIDIGEDGYLGEVWINDAPYGYSCDIVWYKKYWIFRSVRRRERLFSARGGGALKALIRTTNLYFNRNDEVDTGINETDLDEW